MRSVFVLSVFSAAFLLRHSSPLNSQPLLRLFLKLQACLRLRVRPPPPSIPRKFAPTFASSRSIC